MQSQIPTQPARIQSLDLLRGAIMVLMAIDHVRVYSGIPAGGQDPGIFFTRWVTHFCAPGFVFFAGTSAFFYGRKLGNMKTLSRYLLTRGLMLVVLELTLIRFGWTFNFNFSEFTLVGVIWMLGWCMVLLSLLVRLKPVTVGLTGLVIIFLQQLFSLVPRIFPPTLKGLWEFIYSSGNEPWPTGISILYVLVPWIGVMAAGYGFGLILSMEAERRNKICIRVGISSLVVFFVAGIMFTLSKSSTPEAPPFIFRLLNQQKYPPSQLFLLMTLGPALLLVPIAEKAKGAVASWLSTLGRVPFFYYLLHIPLIHVSALLVNFLRVGESHQDWYGTAPFVSVAPESRWSLGLLYLDFVFDIVILSLACRWYARYKANHPKITWLRYM